MSSVAMCGFCVAQHGSRIFHYRDGEHQEVRIEARGCGSVVEHVLRIQSPEISSQHPKRVENVGWTWLK